MGLAKKILRGLKGIAETSSAKKFKDYEAASLIFESSRYDEVIGWLNEILSGIAKNGEVISSTFSVGEVVDSGKKHLDILRGVLYEVYDYKAMSSAFIRVYHLKKDKEWLALYVDENPHTPWWGEKERKKG